jgi:exodeoxyribonuclease VII small subunit
MSDKNKTIQEQMAELQALVNWFQSEEFTLEEAVSKFSDAEALAATIEHDLSELKNNITVIKQRFDVEA